jgi:proteic killer suppression protein
VIISFNCKRTEKVFHRLRGHRFPADIQNRAAIKLRVLHFAQNLNDLRVPPSNHLEALKGDRKGQHSIRINKKWRICFRWTDAGAEDVEIVDYH